MHISGQVCMPGVPDGQKRMQDSLEMKGSGKSALNWSRLVYSKL